MILIDEWVLSTTANVVDNELYSIKQQLQHLEQLLWTKYMELTLKN